MTSALADSLSARPPEVILGYHEGARWSSGIDAAIGARGRGSRPVCYLTVQRPWTNR